MLLLLPACRPASSNFDATALGALRFDRPAPTLAPQHSAAQLNQPSQTSAHHIGAESPQAQSRVHYPIFCFAQPAGRIQPWWVDPRGVQIPPAHTAVESVKPY